MKISDKVKVILPSERYINEHIKEKCNKLEAIILPKNKKSGSLKKSVF